MGKSNEKLVKFEFKVTGMTCVACSGSIERLMHNEFDQKGLKSVSIALLTHKMQTTFHSSVFERKEVTPDLICEEIDCIGFGCELLTITELTMQDDGGAKAKKRNASTLDSNTDQESNFSD